MLQKTLIGFLILIFMLSCNSQTTNENQLVHCDDLNIIINSPDTVAKGQELFASIHIENSKYKLVHAAISCTVTDTSTVDISKNRIFGCNKNLILEHDSVKIWLTAGQEAKRVNVGEITLLAKGNDSKYYYQKCSFDYFVK